MFLMRSPGFRAFLIRGSLALGALCGVMAGSGVGHQAQARVFIGFGVPFFYPPVVSHRRFITRRITRHITHRQRFTRRRATLSIIRRRRRGRRAWRRRGITLLRVITARQAEATRRPEATLRRWATHRPAPRNPAARAPMCARWWRTHPQAAPAPAQDMADNGSEAGRTDGARGVPGILVKRSWLGSKTTR